MSKHPKEEEKVLFPITRPGLYILFGRLSAAPHPKKICKEVVDKGMYAFKPNGKQQGRKKFRANCVKALEDGSLPTPTHVIGHRFGHWGSIGPCTRATIRGVDTDGTWSSFVEYMQDCYPGSKFMRVYAVVHPNHTRSYLGALQYTEEGYDEYGSADPELERCYFFDEYYYPRQDGVDLSSEWVRDPTMVPDGENGENDGRKQTSIKDFFNNKG